MGKFLDAKKHFQKALELNNTFTSKISLINIEIHLNEYMKQKKISKI